MKYDMFQNLVKGLMLGDNVYPNDGSIQLSLLCYAYDKLANESDALRLFSDNTNESIVRDGPGNTYVRKPKLPELLTNGKIDSNYELDIDDELCFPLARYFASFISKDKANIHTEEAEKLIRIYNSKVEAHINKIKQGANYDK